MSDGTPITTDNVKEIMRNSIEISVFSCASEFSYLTKNEFLVYANIPVLCNILDSAFVSYEPRDTEILEKEVDHLYHELQRRATIFTLCSTSEYTMREFISPFLVSSALIAENIQLLCEKNILGSRANGKLDYLAYYKRFVICVTEAQEIELERGMGQTIAQMKACREAFEAQLSFEKTRSKRKFPEVMSAEELLNIKAVYQAVVLYVQVCCKHSYRLT